MVQKKNLILTCLLFSFLHGQWDMSSPTLKHDIALQSAMYPQANWPFVVGDYCMRDVVFEDDMMDLISLDKNCKDHTDRLQKLNIIIQAVNEYHCPRGEEVQVTIKNNEWVIVIKEMTADLLYECLPIEQLLPKQKLSLNPLEKYMSIASRWITKMGLYILGKTLAKYAKCTVVIHSSVRPEDKHILCSELIIDLYDLSDSDRLHVEPQAQDLLNMHIIIKEKA